MRVKKKFILAPPIAPGEVLRDHFLSLGSLTQDQLAKALQVSRISVNQIINGRRAITAEMALRLATVTSTTPELWLNLQRSVDLYEARLKLSDDLPKLKVLRKEKTLSELIVDLPTD